MASNFLLAVAIAMTSHSNACTRHSVGECGHLMCGVWRVRAFWHRVALATAKSDQEVGELGRSPQTNGYKLRLRTKAAPTAVGDSKSDSRLHGAIW